jgi:single-stranded-DNA-specific exonuclease
MSQPSILEIVRDAMRPVAKLVRSFDGLIRVVSHYDADGITAAGIMTRALIKDGKRFRLSFVKGINSEVFTELEHEGMVIILDMGSGQLEAIKKMAANVIILDHHITPELAKTFKKGGEGGTDADPEQREFEVIETEQGRVYEFNCHKFGIDGSYEACGASLAYAFATAMSRMNSSSSAIASAGIHGDHQSQPLVGLNEGVIQEGVGQGYIQEKKNTLFLDGETVRDALNYSVDPYFPGLTGREGKVSEFLNECGFDGSKAPSELSLEQCRHLTNKLMLIHLKNNAPPEAIERLVGTRYFLSEFSMFSDTLSNRLNACGRMDWMTTGVAACLGEEMAMTKAGKLREKHRSTIRNGLVYLESRGIKGMDHIQYFFNNDPASSGAFAGLGIQYLFDRDLPIVALSKKEGKVHISSRGTRELVDRGLNLSVAMREAAQNVGGHGGGHPVASGATIPDGKEMEFLGLVNGIVGQQFIEREKERT